MSHTTYKPVYTEVLGVFAEVFHSRNCCLLSERCFEGLGNVAFQVQWKDIDRLPCHFWPQGLRLGCLCSLHGKHTWPQGKFIKKMYLFWRVFILSAHNHPRIPFSLTEINNFILKLLLGFRRQMVGSDFCLLFFRTPEPIAPYEALNI